MIFFWTLFDLMFCIMNDTRYRQFSLCWKHSLVLTYFKTTMLRHLLMNTVISMWFWIYCKKINTEYLSQWWLEFVLAVRRKSRKSQGIFFCQPRGNPDVATPSFGYLMQCPSLLYIFISISNCSSLENGWSITTVSCNGFVLEMEGALKHKIVMILLFW